MDTLPSLDYDLHKQDELRGLLTLILEGLTLTLPNPVGQVMVGKEFAGIRFPLPMEDGTPDKENEISIEAARIRKGIREYTDNLLGLALYNKPAEVRKGELFLPFELHPNDPIGVEVGLKRINLRMKRVYEARQ